MSKFQPGNTFSQGRPKGSRNKLNAAFFDNLLTVYAESGIDCLRIAAKEEPVQFVKIIASLMPKEVEIQQSQLHELTDEQLAAIDLLLRDALANRAEREGGENQTLN